MSVNNLQLIGVLFAIVISAGGLLVGFELLRTAASRQPVAVVQSRPRRRGFSRYEVLLVAAVLVTVGIRLAQPSWFAPAGGASPAQSAQAVEKDLDPNFAQQGARR